MSEQTPPEISVVIPVFNSRDTLPLLLNKIAAALTQEKLHYEIVAVDDSSSDDSWEVLKQLQTAIPALRCIRFAHNYGQANATMAGISHASGRFIATIDDDLQYNPADIPKLYNAIHSGSYQIVCGFPPQKQHKKIYTLVVRISTFILSNFFLFRLRRVRLFSSFKIYRRELFFLPDNTPTSYHIFHLWKHKPEECGWIPVQHHPRKSGQSGYGIIKLLKHFRIGILYVLKRISGLLMVLFAAIGVIGFIIEQPFFTTCLFACLLFLFLYTTFAILLKKVSKPVYTIAEIR